MSAWLLSDWTLWIATIVLGLVGQALALRGLWGDWARGKPHCRKCWYEMTGSESLTCPECGHVHKSRRTLFASRRHWKKAFVGTALFAIALYCHTGPDVQYRRGVLGEKWWQSVVPTTAWIAMLGELEEDWQYELLEKRLEVTADRQQLAQSVGWLVRNSGGPPLMNPPMSGNTLFAEFDSVDHFKPAKIDNLNFIARSLLLRGSQAVIARKNHPVNSARMQCVQWISALRDDEAAVQALIELANDSDRQVRDVAIHALGDTTILSDNVVYALVAQLRDPEIKVREAAADALGGLGDKAALAVPHLVQWIERPIDGVAHPHRKDDARVAWVVSSGAIQAAWRSLRDIGAPAVPALRHFLKSTDLNICEQAVRTLGEMGRRSRDAWPMLVELATKDDLSFRYLAVDAIKEIGQDTAPLLLEVLRTGATLQRIEAMRILGHFAADHRPTREAIFDLVIGDHDETAIRNTAVAVLTFAKLDAKQFTKDFWRQLVTALTHKRPEARDVARQIILEASDTGLLWIQWALDENLIPLESGLIDLIISFGDKAAHLGPKLVPRMLAEPKKYKSALPDMLSYMGEPKPATLSLLVDALTHSDADVVAMAAESLDALKPPAFVMLPVLYEKLKSPRLPLRRAAIAQMLTLYDRGEPAEAMREAADVLTDFAKQESDEGVRAEAQGAAKRIRSAGTKP